MGVPERPLGFEEILNCQKFYEKRDSIWNHRGDGEKLWPSRKKIKRRRLAGWEIDSLVEGEAFFGGMEGFIPARAQRGGNDHLLKLHNFSAFSVVIF